MAKRLKGKIISDKMDKTVVVEVVFFKKHPIYEKRFKRRKRFKAHDAENSHKEGETVIIEETRPQSRDKRWKIINE